MLHIADVNVGKLKDAFKAVSSVLDENDTIQIHFGKKSYFAINKEVLAQSFFEAFLKDEECEFVVNADDFKSVLTGFRTKSQTVSIFKKDDSLKLTSKTKESNIKYISCEAKKTKEKKCTVIGTISPSDMKCLLKPSHPSKSLEIDGGMNGDLALSNKNGKLSTVFFSYSNDFCMTFAIDGQNEYKDFDCYIKKAYLSVANKLINNAIDSVVMSVAGKFLKLEIGKLSVYLPAIKMKTSMNPEEFDTSGWYCIGVDEAEKEDLKVFKQELDKAEKYKGLFKNVSIGQREKVFKYISWILPSSDTMYIKEIDDLFIVVFERATGRMTIYA